MYKLIQTVGDYYVLSSIQNHINIYNNQSKLLKKKTNKRHQEIYDRGCLYMDKTMKYPIIKSYNAVFKIGNNVNVKDILNLFYTDKELRKKSVLPRPKIIKNYKTYVQSGGNNFKHLVASDPRRYVLINKANSYVIKIARHKDYTCAYEDEAKIYDELGKKDDVVKMYGSGKITNNTINITFDNENIVINENDFQQLNLQKDEIANAQYIILENTNDYKDFYDYINDLNNDKKNTIIQVLKVFHKIMETIKKYNNDLGFFHGDLHGHNVKVKGPDNIKVKLFDFDFSGIINEKSIISRNITIYNLKNNTQPIFSCANDDTINICECETQFNNKSGITDIKTFMYKFDYFRLLLSTIIHLEHKFEKTKGESVINIIKENSPKDKPEDEQIFNKIIIWYETNVIPKWSFCFKNGYFCTNIWQTPHDRVELNKIQNNVKTEMTQKDLENHLDRLRLNRSSGDLSSIFSSIISGGKKSNNTMKKKLKKKY